VFDFSVFTHPDAWAALLTLALMEIVLGIDNIVFLSITTDRLPKEEQGQARTIGLGLALLMRIGLLLAIKWVMGLKDNLFFVMDEGISGRDLILAAGGLFLLGKATVEIFENIEMSGEDEFGRKKGSQLSMASALIQIVLLDIVFSLDSVITAVGMAESVLIMILAMIAAMVIMLVFAKSVADFINQHPSMKILGLAFLLLIGVLLVAESLDQHVNKGYIYFAMAFSLAIELINMRMRKKAGIQHTGP
jgi:predicted tellurium resistance membrane protein TerC